MALKPFEKHAIRFMAGHLLVGVFAAAAFTGLLLYFDLFGLWQLVSTTDRPILAVAMLFGGSVVTFGSLAMGAGVMMLGEEDDDHRPPRDRG